MIKASSLPSYEIQVERFDSAGFIHGVAYLQVKLSYSGFIPYWWCSCRECGLLTVLAVAELGKRDCPHCGYNSADVDVVHVDYSVDRSLRSWEMHQEDITAAYLLGGYEAAQEIASALHAELHEAGERYKAKQEAIRQQWQP